MFKYLNTNIIKIESVERAKNRSHYLFVPFIFIISFITMSLLAQNITKIGTTASTENSNGSIGERENKLFEKQQGFNSPPQITSPDTANATVGIRFVYKTSAIDPDGPILEWIFQNLPSWLSAGADSVFGIPPEGAMDTTLLIIATDGISDDSLVAKIIFKFKSWKWIAFGDTRNNKPEHRQVLEAIITNTPDYKFIINVGDVVDHGDIESEWIDWYQTTIDVLGNLGQDQVPPKYMSVPGNHDATETVEGLKNWNKYLSGQVQQFGNEGKFFTFDNENARFIILDSEGSLKNGAQYSMLTDVIKDNPKTWLFMITHRPIFDFGNYTYQDEIHDLWGIPLYQYGCDIIFNGHDHFYLRTKKLQLNGTINPPLDPEYGTIQIISSNGGASLRDINPDKDGNGYFVETYIKEYGYTELNVNGDSLYLRHILRDGTIFDQVTFTPNPKSGITSIFNRAETASTPNSYELSQNYPNPFNPSTTIEFKMAKDGQVVIHVFDILGKQKVSILNQYFKAGTHSVKWNAGGFSAGLYFIKMEVNGYVKTRKMLLIN